MTIPPMPRPRPVLLCILDGWGCASGGSDNAIALARKPVWDRLVRTSQHAVADASELHVGLPSGQMGNSEVGHMNLGAGRVVMQDLPRIDAAFAGDHVGEMPAFRDFVAALKRSGGACHLMGLMSPGGVHSHQGHLPALARLRVPAVYKTLMAIASSRASGLIPDARPRPWYVRVWMRA